MLATPISSLDTQGFIIEKLEVTYYCEESSILEVRIEHCESGK